MKERDGEGSGPGGGVRTFTVMVINDRAFRAFSSTKMPEVSKSNHSEKNLKVTLTNSYLP
jgi:hypothetical protein